VGPTAVIAVALKDLRELLGRPWQVPTLILGPLLLLLVFGIGADTTAQPPRTVVVLPPGQERPRLLEEYQSQFEAFLRVTAYTDDEAAALRQLERRAVDAVVILPGDAFGTIVAGRQATIRVFYNQIDPVWQWVVPNFAVTMAGAINRQIVLQAVGGQQASLAQAAIDLARVDELLTLASRAADTWDQAEVARLLAAAREQTDDLAAALDTLGPEAEPLQREVAAVQARIAAAERELAQAGLLEERPSGTPLRERLGLDGLAAQVGQLSQALGQITTLPPEVVVAPLAVEARNVARLQPDILTFYAPSVLALLAQHIAVSMGALALVRERLSGAFDLYAVAPATGFQLLIGKYVAYVGFTLVVAAVVVAVLLGVLGVPLLGSPWHFALALALLAVASTGLGLACSLIATSERQAVQLSLLALLAVVFFSGFTLPLNSLRQPALAIAYALPATYGTMLLQDTMLRGSPGDPRAYGALAALSLGLCLACLALLRWRLRPR
jgi:ABC-2 type transport system permease protein